MSDNDYLWISQGIACIIKSKDPERGHGTILASTHLS